MFVCPVRLFVYCDDNDDCVHRVAFAVKNCASSVYESSVCQFPDPIAAEATRKAVAVANTTLYFICLEHFEGMSVCSSHEYTFMQYVYCHTMHLYGQSTK